MAEWIETYEFDAMRRRLDEFLPYNPLNARYAKELIDEALKNSESAPVSVSGLIIPDTSSAEGVLIRSASSVWFQVIEKLATDWSLAFQIPPDKWEEIIAGAFNESGFDSVTLTPRSGDHGRDVIAIRNGVGCVKIIGSVKAYKPRHLVGYDDVRALLGVMSGERDTSKGIITTTSDFPKRITSDPFIEPFIPYRLELMNGPSLRKWLSDILASRRKADEAPQ